MAVSLTAAEFLVEECAMRPGQVTMLALGPLTNLAMAMQLDPAFMTNMVSTAKIFIAPQGHHQTAKYFVGPLTNLATAMQLDSAFTTDAVSKRRRSTRWLFTPLHSFIQRLQGS